MLGRGVLAVTQQSIHVDLSVEVVAGAEEKGWAKSAGGPLKGWTTTIRVPGLQRRADAQAIPAAVKGSLHMDRDMSRTGPTWT